MSDTDQQIVEAALHGDQHRFSELVTRYQKPIVNYVYRMLGHYEDAVDISQDVFLKAYSGLQSYRPKYPFTAWLFRIARNATIDELRRRRLATVSLDAPIQAAEGTIERDVADTGIGPEEELLHFELRSRLATAIGGLADRYREPLVLRHAGGLSYDEISEALGLPLGTVKTRIFRAREALRRQLGDLLEDHKTPLSISEAVR